MIDLTKVAEAIILLVIALVTTFLIPYLKEKLDAEKFAKLQSWVKVAVDAAEMIYKGPGKGAEKKAYAINYLRQKGYNLNTETIDALIEAAVLSLQHPPDTNVGKIE